MGSVVLLFATGFFGAICFLLLRVLTSWPTWLEIVLSAVAGVLGLLGVFLVPPLFGDEALMFESRPLLGAGARRNSHGRVDHPSTDKSSN